MIIKCKYCNMDVTKDTLGINYVGRDEAYHGGCKLRADFNSKKFVNPCLNEVKKC